MDQAINLLDLHHSIARFLSTADLCSCIRVSHQWNTSFIPFVWRSFRVTQGWDSSAAHDAFHRHAHYIHNLKVLSDQDLTPFLMNCTNLRNILVGDWFFDATTGDTFSDVMGEWSLTLWSDVPNAGSSTKDEFWVQLAALALRNPSLECVMLHFEWDCGPTAEFLRALGSCPRMRKYESVKCLYDDTEQIQALMSILCRLEKVAFRWDNFEPLPACWKLPKVKQLTLQAIHTPGLEDIIETRKIDMVCCCPNLRTLNWAVGMYCPFPIQEFCDRVPAACPNLRQLSFDYDLAFNASYNELDIIRQSFKDRVRMSLGRERHYREPYCNSSTL